MPSWAREWLARKIKSWERTTRMLVGTVCYLWLCTVLVGAIGMAARFFSIGGC